MKNKKLLKKQTHIIALRFFWNFSLFTLFALVEVMNFEKASIFGRVWNIIMLYWAFNRIEGVLLYKKYSLQHMIWHLITYPKRMIENRRKKKLIRSIMDMPDKELKRLRDEAEKTLSAATFGNVADVFLQAMFIMQMVPNLSIDLAMQIALEIIKQPDEQKFTGDPTREDVTMQSRPAKYDASHIIHEQRRERGLPNFGYAPPPPPNNEDHPIK